MFLTGIVLILYFECAAALLKPPSGRKKGRNWGLLAYTTFLFALGTIYTICNLRVRELSYIDNREFPGKAHSLPPGPIGYTLFSQSKPTSMLSNTSFTVANWMADGLLVSWCNSQPAFLQCSLRVQMYRAYIIYGRQRSVLIFPALMYLASMCAVTQPCLPFPPRSHYH